MHIKRGGKNIKLTEQEMTRAYYEMQEEFMRQDIERQLNEACGELSIHIPNRIWKQLVSKALERYQKHESNNESWLDNCRYGIREAAGNTPALAKRTAARLKNHF